MTEIKAFGNGLKYMEISNKSANASIALQGAHLFHYRRRAELPLVWLSKNSLFEPGKAIRGGVPICWPWFGQYQSGPAMPQHGFARTSLWELLETHETAKDTSEVTMQLKDSPESLKLWPFRFELLLHVNVSRSLTISLITRNLDDKPFKITSALHSYLAVSDIGETLVEGLDGRHYFDKVTGQPELQKGHLQIDRETDRVYQHVKYPLSLHDGERTINIDAQGCTSAVVWNPWKDKCMAMADMPDDGWKTMLCIEAANALEDRKIIQPGEEHTLTAVIS